MSKIKYKDIPNFVSTGDFIDLYFRIRWKGLGWLVKKFHLSSLRRTKTQWNETVSIENQWWHLQRIQEHWNEKVSGDKTCSCYDFLIKEYIPHNFANNNQEAETILSYLFSEEDSFIEKSGESDFIFGIYRKNSAC